MPLLADLADVGRDPVRGGWSRHVFDAADRELRDWFVERAERLGLDVERDRNGNLWAWWGTPGDDAFVAGSHLDSVPGGGELDGPLGVVAGLEAVARLQADGHRPSRPVAIAVFAEEEGSRFGVACLGSRLATGALAPERARALADADGRSLADVFRDAGVDPAGIGPDPASVGRIGTFVELHVEQGRGLVDLGAPVALASSILGHGRWRFRFTGQGNHAGATRMTDRRDPMVAAAATIAAVPALARAAGDDARATVGRLRAVPGGTNVIASAVEFWLDARAASDAVAQSVVEAVASAGDSFASANGCTLDVDTESWSARVDFADGPRAAIGRAIGDVPVLPTGAGHDAGVLAEHVPTAMLFVRNPTGISHAPEESASDEDCEAGVDALVRIMRAAT